MKIPLAHSPANHRRQSGSAVIVILAFLTIMVLLVGANTKTINALRAEVRLTDQRETKRLAASETNSPSLVSTNPAPVSPP